MRLMIVGEAWGEEEERQRRPFVGPSGKLLSRFLQLASLPPLKECFVTNVFNLRPERNKVESLCGGKKEGKFGVKPLGQKYILPHYWPEVERLWQEVRDYDPTMILSLGNTPLWALVSGVNKVGNVRGTVMPSHIEHPDGTPIKVLPTYHPASVLRQYDQFPIVLADMFKARRELEFPEIRRPSRKVWLYPNFADLERFYNEHLYPRRDEPWGVDIETKQGSITEIGFGRPDLAICIPFLTRPNKNYWPSLAEEIEVWKIIKKYCDTLTCPVFQNGLYDLSYLWSIYGVKVTHAGEDTMLMHHALQPEMLKGLGFLGSVYTDEPSWKLMRNRSSDMLKQED